MLSKAHPPHVNGALLACALGTLGNAHGQSTNLGEPNAINLPFGNGSPIHKNFVILGMAYCWVYHILKEP